MDALTIILNNVDRDSDTYSLSLQSPYLSDVETIDQVGGYSELEKLAALRDSLEIDTAEGRLKCNLSPARAVELLEDLRELGSVAFLSLIGGESYRGRRQRIQRYVEKVLANIPMGSTPVLALSSPVDLPIDLMTILDSGTNFDPGSGTVDYQGERLAIQATNCFIGFRFAVRKISARHTAPIDFSLASTGGLTMVYPYWHRGLDYINEELQRLRAVPWFDVVDPMPDRAIAKQSHPERKLARRLVEHVDGGAGVVHFTCHCDSGSRTPPLERRLVLAARDNFRLYKVSIAVRNIQAASIYMKEHAAPLGPLAFLSACAAADVSYDSPVSIPEALLYCGYRSVIAPLVSVHVELALEMATLFYAGLSNVPSTVGQALVDARFALLRSHRNPLGLLYGCYGDSRIGRRGQE